MTTFTDKEEEHFITELKDLTPGKDILFLSRGFLQNYVTPLCAFPR